MKRLLLLLPMCLMFLSGTGGISAESNAIRTVTLRSHLLTDAAIDPVLHLGESIRLQPDASEPFTTHETLDVKLPGKTPYTGHHRQLYLRGYAIGQASKQNGQFL